MEKNKIMVLKDPLPSIIDVSLKSARSFMRKSDKTSFLGTTMGIPQQTSCKLTYSPIEYQVSVSLQQSNVLGDMFCSNLHHIE